MARFYFIIFGDPFLRMRAIVVTDFDQHLCSVADDMRYRLRAAASRRPRRTVAIALSSALVEWTM